MSHSLTPPKWWCGKSKLPKILRDRLKPPDLSVFWVAQQQHDDVAPDMLQQNTVFGELQTHRIHMCCLSFKESIVYRTPEKITSPF